MNKHGTSPPKLLLRFFRWFCHPKLRTYIEGDLMELYDERLKESGKRKADIKFIVDVLLLFRPGIIRPQNKFYTLNSNGMFSNYFKVAIRNMLKQRAFSFINVFGLSIAMSVCLLVILMVADQVSYDQFHPKKERIHRILSERPYSPRPFASTPASLGPSLKGEYSVVENATRLIIGVGGEAIYNQRTVEMRGFFGDEDFFRVFGFELERGNKATALTAPNQIVITHELSRKLFGDDNPVGKTIEFVDRGLHYLKGGKDALPTSWGSFTVTGVISDKKYKSHLKFDVLMSVSSRELLANQNKLSAGDSWDGAFTYVLLTAGKDENDLNVALKDLFKLKYSNVEVYKDHALKAQPLPAITPGIMVNQPTSFQLQVGAYYFLGAIALAIMLSACLNYTNLSTARALTRIKEIGIRKVTGARRKDLIVQFLSESVMTAFLALGVAMLLIALIKPAFVGLWLNQYLNFDLEAPLSVYLIFAAFALLIGIVAGLYPAVYLSAFRPAKAIKNFEHDRAGKMGVRKVLNVSQFVISLFFVVTSILIYTQFSFFMRFDYGFNSTDIVNVPLQGNEYQKIANAFSTVPGVTAISASEYIPATGRSSGMQIDHPENSEPVDFRILSANEDFIDNLELKIIAGRNLSPGADSASNFIVINETGARALGFHRAADAVGVGLIQSWNKESLEVVGVIEDFWVKLPIGGDRMEPAFLQNLPKKFSYANVRIVPGNERETFAQLEREWKKADPYHAFKFESYDEQLSETHAGIFDVASIMGFLAFIAVTIACLGMLGMTTYTAERRRKEISIRKVLGAESAVIAFMLSWDFLKVLLISLCIGAPISYFVNNLWLQIFPTRAPFGVWIIVQGTLIMLVLGLLTIGSQTISASRRNPVKSLKAD